MTFELRPLPYDRAALEPVSSARTVDYHYGKHHAGYVQKLNSLIAGTDYEKLDLEAIIRRTAGKTDKKEKQIFNNAAQVWNHDFFWDCLAPSGGGQPPEPLQKIFAQSFDSVENFKTRFVDAAVAQFGSGWAWLALNKGKLEIMTTGDAELPFTSGAYPVFTCDVWEHAYYLDHQNDRGAFVKGVLDTIANWQFIGKRLSHARAAA